MIQTGIIENAHGDLVTDVAYDFYGLRLATCSLDQRIKVWQLDETNGAWIAEDDWKAHAAAVAKLSWAHPEFGSIIASASYDHSVKIWEQFAPHHFGLKLATVSSDNRLRVYECLEQPALTTWQICDDIDASAPAPLVTQALNTASMQQSQKAPGLSNTEADGGWSISWCKDRYWGEVLAVAAGTSSVVRVTTAGGMDVDDGQQSSAPYSITSVSWAPSCGRSYHLIATGGRDGRVRIWRVKPGPEDDESQETLTDGRRPLTVLSSAGNDGRVRLWKATSGTIGVQEAEKVDSTEKDEEMET
ncbi:WD40-repeat-containing domain protein [Schizophyllum amplum]|uniref:WD40-repeat-containing domain protein n=1 Tax=Schizophyllum amplum TaxID=97359 RepID=A0A550C2J7_9AGAR|nr:WD40-repeat-containing domain protein [Auriculariopsis ampla]